VIKTKSIYAPKERGDGFRVLITRYYPRGVKKTHFDEWIRELAPSRDLLKFYKEEKINWKHFEQEFLIQMKSSIESLEMIQTFANTATKQHVTLLCYEKEGDPCHRYLVETLIRKEMNEIPQLLTKIS